MLLIRIAKEIWGTPREWAPRNPIRPVIGTDGSKLYGPVMCRFVNGKPQYRAMTEQEREDYFEREAW
jgi:hypothetical protein